MTSRPAINLRKHDLNLFVVFAALMQERSVSRAARSLNMSQSAVSAALARLRGTYEDRLFVRVQGGVEPTLRALRMNGAVQEALRAIEVAVGGQKAFNPAKDTFQLRIGMSDDLEAVVMTRLLTEISPESPGMSVFSVLTTRLLLPRLLETGEADMGIVANSAWNSSLRHRVLFQSGYLTVYDSAQVGQTGALSLADYVALPHIMISVDATRGIVDSELEKLGMRRHRVASTAHFAMAPLLLRRTPAVSTMPAHVAHVFAQEFGLTVADPPIEFPPFELAAVWHQTRDSDPEVGWMVDTISALTSSTSTPRSIP
ncbi:LysR family transcriptional regulator [Microbacterium sorbitolivorans]|nr:LysR substrate-binding domain-containing protein [Microbacterium sorbitolivorans]GGF41700.1 LysR family transcriptional regulator [Microbacterium sorbitolivorans]